MQCKGKFKFISVYPFQIAEFNVDDMGSDKLTIGSGSESGGNSTIIAELTGQVNTGIQYATNTNEGWVTFETDRTRSGPGWVLDLSAAREDGLYSQSILLRNFTLNRCNPT